MHEFKDVAIAESNNIATTLWFAIYETCMTNAKDLSEIVLEESWITDDPAHDDDGKKGCAKDIVDAPACDDTKCAGNNGARSKVDWPRPDNQLQDPANDRPG